MLEACRRGGGGAVALLVALRLLADGAALRLAQVPDGAEPAPSAAGSNASNASAGAEEPGRQRPVPRPLAWLHIPKCGTSFANVLYSHPQICQTLPADAKLRPGDTWSVFVKRHSLEEHCPGSFAQPFTGEHFGLGWDYWHIGGGHVVAFFRQPEQRIISGYLDKKKDYPYKWDADIPPLKYAQAMKGCATRMLTRGLMPCGDLLGDPTPEEKRTAVQRVQELAFVGLTDEWDLSVCLFYRMFGGNCTDLAFLNMRPGKGRTNTTGLYDASSGLYNASHYLGTFKDPFDGPVYEKAKEVFWARVAKYEVSRSSCARTCAAAVATKPFAVEESGQTSLSQRTYGAEASEYDWPGRRTYAED